jgi:hypothetical protein
MRCQAEAWPRRREAFPRLAVVLQRVQAKSTASQFWKALLWGTMMVRRRGRSREGLDAAELVIRPMRGESERGIGISCLAA